MNAIECKGLWKIYSNRVKVEAIKNLDLSLEPGRIYIVAGPNGAGKTTFLRMISTELLPTRGELSVLDHDALHDQWAIRQAIGVMPQEIRLYGQLTVWEHIYYFTLLKGLSKNDAKEETERVITDLKLKEIEDRMVDHLSGGQRRQVLLAQAIAGDSDLLLLDEPTTGLDPEARDRIWNLIKSFSINNKKTIIVTTHYLDEAQAIADEVLMFNKGSLIAGGGVDDVMSRVGYESEITVRYKKEIEMTLDELELLSRRSVMNNEMMIWAKKDEVEKIIGSLITAGTRMSEITISRPGLEKVYLDIMEKENET